MSDDGRQIDPGILEIVGAIAQVLGFAEQVQRVMPTDRLGAQRKHKRIDRLLKKFVNSMDDARLALRAISGALGPGASDLPQDVLNFHVSRGDFAILTRGVRELHDAIKRMTDTTFELEAIAAGMPDETQRYYRISEAGRTVLDDLMIVLGGKSSRIRETVDAAEHYLDQSARMLETRGEWLEFSE